MSQRINAEQARLTANQTATLTVQWKRVRRANLRENRTQGGRTRSLTHSLISFAIACTSYVAAWKASAAGRATAKEQ